MIKKDKSIYLNYAKDIITKVDSIQKKLASTTLTAEQKQDVEKQRIRILARIDLVKIKANSNELIPETTWQQTQEEINCLDIHLFNTTNQLISPSQNANHYSR